MKTNIILILTDDQGKGDLHCYGNDIIHTENIDRLHDESICFENYHTGPTCAPTRAGLLSGRYHNSAGVWHTLGGRSLLRRSHNCLAQILKDNGYATGIFGKWHLGDNEPYRPQDRGFEESVVHGGGGIGQTPDFWGNDYFDDTYSHNGVPEKYNGYCTDVFFDLAKDFIHDRKDKPFFCYLALNAPHFPLQVPQKYYDLYKGKIHDPQAKFFGMITCIDENIGKLEQFLKEEKLDENTAVIFMTDNGSANGCCTNRDGFVTYGYNMGMRGKKGSPFEGGHRTPFFLRYPKRYGKEQRNINEVVANIDILPTILDLCEVDGSAYRMDGKSLVPLIEGHSEEFSERVIVTDSQRLPNPKKYKDYAVMWKNYRLVNGKLYNLETDWEQRTDISEQEPKIFKKLSDEYEIWWKDVTSNADEEVPISIGGKERVVMINSMDWRGDVGDCAWNQGEIRSGKVCNSYVEIKCEKDGVYNFELMRWPKECGNKITEGMDGEITDWFTGGVALDIKEAKISIGSYTDSKAVDNRKKSITFQTELKKGNYHLQTWFVDSQGVERGAYYVYISDQERV